MITSNRPAATVEARDRAARLLRRLTVGATAGSLAAVGLLGAVAAITIPGTAHASAQTGSSTSGSSTSGTPAASSGTSGTPTSSSGHATSGGS